MKQNLRIKRSEKTIEVQPDGGNWMLAIDENGDAKLWAAVTGCDEGGANPVEGWMPAEIVAAMDAGDDELVKVLLDRWQGNLAIDPPDAPPPS